MSKFVIVDKAPEKLKDGEYVITQPNFLDEIKTAKNQPRPLANGQYLTTLNHLRSIGGVIGELYDPENFNPYSSIPFNHFEGRPYDNLEDLSPIVLEMFQKHYPHIFFQYVDKKVKARPQGTELVYFVGDKANAEALLANGLDEVSKKTSKTVKKAE